MECPNCQKEFKPTYIQLWKANKGHNKHTFCSRPCRSAFYRNTVETECAQCNKAIAKPASELKKSKSGNMFCSLSCAVTWGNYTSKKRDMASSLEKFIQKSLKKDFPETEFLFSDNDTIGAELDIYMPKFKSAIEIHGPFHYKPVRGGFSRFLHTLTNDARKSKMAKNKGITIYVLNAKDYRGLTKAAKARYYGQVKKLVEALINHDHPEVQS